MNPTPSHRPREGYDGAPTVREVAELTARLRDLSSRGRSVDPHERAAFLADKDALIARITDAQHDADALGTRYNHDMPPRRLTDVEMPAHLGPYCLLDDAEQQEARREQLARWHTDDTHGAGAGAAERRGVLDDGPGLP